MWKSDSDGDQGLVEARQLFTKTILTVALKAGGEVAEIWDMFPEVKAELVK